MSNKKNAYIERMNFLADSKKPILSESTELETLVSYKKGTDGRYYGVVKENKNYYIKSAIKEGNRDLKASDFTYINGLQNVTNFQYNSLAEAEKNLNLKLKTINESYKYKFVNGKLIKEAAEAPIEDKEEMDVEVDAEMPTDEPMDAEVAPEGDDAAPSEEPVAEPEGDDMPMVDGGEEMPTDEPMDAEVAPEGDDEPSAEDGDPFEEVQSVLGKLGVKIRNIELSAPNVKSILNSVIGYLNPYMDTLSQEEKIEIAKKIKSSGESVEEGFEGGEMTQFDEFMQNDMGVLPGDDASEIASAIMTWANKMEFGENNGDFEAVAEYVTPEVMAQLKGNVNPNFESKLVKAMGSMQNVDAVGLSEELDIDNMMEDMDDDTELEVEMGDEPMDMDMEDSMGDEPMGMEAPQMGVGAPDVAIGLDSASSGKKVTIDLKNDTIDVNLNESQEKILRKYIVRKLEESFGLRKKSINESKQTKTTKYVDSLIESAIKEHKNKSKKINESITKYYLETFIDGKQMLGTDGTLVLGDSYNNVNKKVSLQVDKLKNLMVNVKKYIKDAKNITIKLTDQSEKVLKTFDVTDKVQN
jgi:hypothetical protein